MNGTAWDECSDTADPSWNGYPGCHLTNNPWGWQICTAFGYGQNMRFLQNSSKGLQWGEKWQHWHGTHSRKNLRLDGQRCSTAHFCATQRHATPRPCESCGCPRWRWLAYRIFESQLERTRLAWIKWDV